MDIMKCIAINIREKKDAQGLSIDKLSIKSGIGTNTIKSIINQKIKDTGIKNIVLISSALNCSIEDLTSAPKEK